MSPTFSHSSDGYVALDVGQSCRHDHRHQKTLIKVIFFSSQIVSNWLILAHITVDRHPKVGFLQPKQCLQKHLQISTPLLRWRDSQQTNKKAAIQPFSRSKRVIRCPELLFLTSSPVFSLLCRSGSVALRKSRASCARRTQRSAAWVAPESTSPPLDGTLYSRLPSSTSSSARSYLAQWSRC